MRQVLPLFLHDNTLSPSDVLVNLSLFPADHTIIEGNVLQLVAINHSTSVYDAQEAKARTIQTQSAVSLPERNSKFVESPVGDGGDGHGHPADYRKGYFFLAKEMDPEHLSILDGVQVNYPAVP